MSLVSQGREPTDTELAAAARDGKLPDDCSVADLAFEMLRARRARREDSRRAEQVRKIRRVAEGMLTTIENLAHVETEAEYVVDRIAAWLEREGKAEELKIAQWVREGRWK